MPTATLRDGQVVRGCRIIRFIDRGGMGEVYLAEHLALQKPVALKILPPDLDSREHIDRFLREARVCSRIEHPNVVVIHDVGEEHGLYYIVMQYVLGKNLVQLLRAQGGPLPWRSAARIIQLAAQGLHAVHSQGLVHRDVKPSNIMLASDSRVLLMDFGLVHEDRESGWTDDDRPPRGQEDHPVANIAYEDAEAYCRWVGKTLPTREQWMRAYRGDNDTLFPWGDQYDSARVNVSENPKFKTTSGIGETPKDVSPFMVYNMVGNAKEFIRGWTWYEGQKWRIVKGADYKMFGYVFGVGSCQFRYGEGVTNKGTGFRCVREEPQPAAPP
jgi:serine/threonine protein kinase